MYRISSVNVYPHNEHGEQLETGMKTYWHVYKDNKLLTSFDNRNDAEIYCQDEVANAQWCASNRD